MQSGDRCQTRPPSQTVYMDNSGNENGSQRRVPFFCLVYGSFHQSRTRKARRVFQRLACPAFSISKCVWPAWRFCNFQVPFFVRFLNTSAIGSSSRASRAFASRKCSSALNTSYFHRGGKLNLRNLESMISPVCLERIRRRCNRYSCPRLIDTSSSRHGDRWRASCSPSKIVIVE